MSAQELLPKVLFEAFGLPWIDRRDWLRTQLEDDPQLLRLALELVAADERMESEPDGATALDAWGELEAGGTSERRVLDGFVLIDRIGHGGSGVVYRAFDQKSQQEVGLKILSPHLWDNGRARARFEREAAVLRRTDHPSIVPLIEARLHGDAPVLAMRFMEGGTLADLLQKWRAEELSETQVVGDLDRIRHVVEIVTRVARAVGHAHAIGIVHRDIKPSNILFSGAGDAFLGDFGVAWVEREAALTTRTGETPGTTVYMSPEQTYGCRAGADARSDIFALGIVLAEAATLMHPFDLGAADLSVAAIRDGVPRGLGRLRRPPTGGLAEICERCLAKEATRRYQTADELIADLDAWRSGKPIARQSRWFSSRGARIVRHARLWSKKRKVGLAGGLAAIAITAVLSLWVAHDDESRNRVRVEVLNSSGADVWVEQLSIWTPSGDQQNHSPSEPVLAANSDVLWLEPGHYRLSGGFSGQLVEREIWMPEPGRVRVDMRAREWADPSESMVLIAATKLPEELHGGQSPQSTRPGDTVPGAFWIDRSEVTNSQYAKFVEETGARAPAYWSLVDPTQTPWRDLPVVGVTQPEAQQFAEWKGVRLPTSAEWARAAELARQHRENDTPEEKAGSSSRQFGDSATPEFVPMRSVLEQHLERLQAGLLSASPAHSDGTLSSGQLAHFLGGVSEWTSTRASPFEESASADAVIVRGGNWKSDPVRAIEVFQLFDPSLPHWEVGFRCAASARRSEGSPAD